MSKLTPPKPTKTVRKLTLSKEKLVKLTDEKTSTCSYTRRLSGCPIHTC